MLALLMTHLLNTISYITIRIPVALYRILTWSFTVQLNFWGLLLVFAVILAVVYLVVREKCLTQYSHLEPIGTTKPELSNFDLHPKNTAQDDHPDAFLETFLSSTKLFGYLEQPAFHEISRHVQIRNLPKGDFLFNDHDNREEESFHFVVRGNVNVYIKSKEIKCLPWDDISEQENIKNCTLINQAGPGDNISSLFTILAAFRECQDRDTAKLERKRMRKQQRQKLNQQRQSQRRTSHSDSSNYLPSQRDSGVYSSSNDASRSASPSLSSNSDHWSPVLPCFDSDTNLEVNPNPGAVYYENPLDFTDSNRKLYNTQDTNNSPYNLHKLNSKSNAYKSVQPDIIARAAKDTILAVIPKEAFYKIYKNFPKSASLITKVILTRFQKVSMMASRRYFGLTNLTLKTEYLLNRPEVPDYISITQLFKDKDMLNRIKSCQHMGGQQELQRSTTVNEASVLSKPDSNSDKPCNLQERRSRGPKLLSLTSYYTGKDESEVKALLAIFFMQYVGLNPLSSENDDVHSPSSSEESAARFGLSSIHDEPRDIPNIQSTDDVTKHIQVLSLKEHSVLIEEGHKSDGLYFVIDGFLEALVEQDKHDTPCQENDDRNQSDSPEYLTVDGKDTAYRFPYGRAPSCHSNVAQEAKQNTETKRHVFTIGSCRMAGYLSALTDCPSTFEIRASTDCIVGYLPKESLQQLAAKFPSIMVDLARRIMNTTKPLLLHIDIALEWMHVSAGHIIYHKDDPVDSTLIVLHGRLRAIQEKENGGIEITGEFGRGDGIGELEVLTTTPSPWTLHAIRDSELVHIPKTLFNALMQRYPQITLNVSRLVALRSLQLTTSRDIARINEQLQREKVIQLAGASAAYSATHRDVVPELYGRNNTKMRTVGIIPVNSNVPIMAFAEHLKSALIDSVGAKCMLLNNAIATTAMGKQAFSRLGQHQLATWLAELEEKEDILLYVADSGERSSWTRTCMRQADCIFLVGEADGDSFVGEYERILLDVKTTARKELVLLHEERSCASGVTKSWLKDRMWIQAHHHVMMPCRGTSTKTSQRPRFSRSACGSFSGQPGSMASSSINLYNQIKDRVPFLWNSFLMNNETDQVLNKNQSSDDSYHGSLKQTKEDFSRLGRRLCGTSVALVLSGGGARGIGHAAFIRSLEEVGIPIDIIGGTSIGSLISGCYAKNMNVFETAARTKSYAKRAASLWRQLFDLTYPVVARYTGYSLNRAIWKCIGDAQIEDFWLPFFAITTNITYSRMEAHTSGYAWKYIRASMSLSGQTPPLVDHGNMLMDGSYMDNLPVSVAKDMGADIIVAVDVSLPAVNHDQKPIQFYKDSLNGWYALLHNTLNPFKSFTIPNMDQVQQRLASVLGVTRLQEAKTIDGTLYAKLPSVPLLNSDPTQQFGQFDTIYQSSYQVAHQIVTQWGRQGFASGRVSSSLAFELAGNDNTNNDQHHDCYWVSNKNPVQSKNRRNSV